MRSTMWNNAFDICFEYFSSSSSSWYKMSVNESADTVSNSVNSSFYNRTMFVLSLHAFSEFYWKFCIEPKKRRDFGTGNTFRVLIHNQTV